MNALQHVDIRIRGRVQGVGFRYRARLKACELGVAGLARNEPDGSVYIEAEGDLEALKAFINWCWHGPNRAQVESVRFSEGKMKRFKSFTTEHGTN